MATTTKTKDYLGRELVTPDSDAKDYLGRDCRTGNKDYLGRALNVTEAAGAHPASIAPATGPAAGGTAVTITGTDFTGATAVTIGGGSATSFVVVDDSTITCATPAHAAGAVDVVVVHAGGNGTLTAAYTYV